MRQVRVEDKTYLERFGSRNQKKSLGKEMCEVLKIHDDHLFPGETRKGLLRGVLFSNCKLS